MSAFEQLVDTEDQYGMSDEQNSVATHIQAKVISYRKSKGSLVNTNHLPPSPADSLVAESRLADGAVDLTDRERDRLTNQMDRGAPGDAAIFSDRKTEEQRQLAKAKSQFYNKEFAYREPNTSARERVVKESIVMADVRTNVIINDEYTFITDLSYNLSNRYQRPESSILVSVHHSICMVFAGSFEPAYTVTITALPGLVQPMTNRRNAALLQRGLEEALGVPPSRGIIKFLAMPEDNYAFDGNTYAGEMDELSRNSEEASQTIAGRAKKRSSMRSLRNFGRGDKADESRSMTPPSSLKSPLAPLPPGPPEKTAMDRIAEKAQTVSRRRSFVASMFGRKG